MGKNSLFQYRECFDQYDFKFEMNICLNKEQFYYQHGHKHHIWLLRIAK